MDEIDKTFDWHAAAVRGVRGPIDADNPKAGFYRTKSGRDGPLVPIAFWYDTHDGTLRCHKSGKSIPDLDARELWVHASKNPITADAYWHRIDTGQWLDDDSGAVAAAKGPDIDPATDPVGSMKAEIEKARAGLPTYKAIDSDEQAARAQTLRSALTALAGKAEKQRKALKQPHIDAGKKVDEQWMPLSKSAQDGADDIRRALSAWEDQKRLAARNAEHEANRKAAEHAAAVRAAEEANQPPPPPPPKQVAPNMPAPATQIKGASGRAASVTVANFITDIDLDKCFVRFRDAPELRELFMKLADKAIKAGVCTSIDVGAVFEEKSVVK